MATAVSRVSMTMASISSATSRPTTNCANGCPRWPSSERVRVATMVEDSEMIAPRNSASMPFQPNRLPMP
ncbi:hypothetical protein RLIN73S_04638 [Rhodanobacter lindaniclasticus]